MIAEVSKIQAQGGTRESRAISNSQGQLLVIKTELAETGFRE